MSSIIFTSALGHKPFYKLIQSAQSSSEGIVSESLFDVCSDPRRAPPDCLTPSFPPANELPDSLGCVC